MQPTLSASSLVFYLKMLEAKYLSTSDKNGFLVEQLVMCGETLTQSYVTQHISWQT